MAILGHRTGGGGRRGLGRGRGRGRAATAAGSPIPVGLGIPETLAHCDSPKSVVLESLEHELAQAVNRGRLDVMCDDEPFVRVGIVPGRHVAREIVFSHLVGFRGVVYVILRI